MSRRSACTTHACCRSWIPRRRGRPGAAGRAPPAQRAGVRVYDTLETGDKAIQFSELKNAGDKTWFRDGAIPVRLGSSDPFDRASPFFTDGDWISPARGNGLHRGTI